MNEISYLGKYVQMQPTIEKLKKLEKLLEKEGYSLGSRYETPSKRN